MPRKGGKGKSQKKAKHVARGQLGRMLMKSKSKAAKERAAQRAAGEFIDERSSSERLASVTAVTDLDEFISAAEVTGRDFRAEQHETIILGDDGLVYGSDGQGKTPQQAAVASSGAESDVPLQIPRKPDWNESMDGKQVDKNEQLAFLQWRRALAEVEERLGIGGVRALAHQMEVTPFERNLHVWRQLWRVIEQCDVLAQIVDARHPALYRSRDLEKYVREVNPNKATLLILNKSDFLTPAQRLEWADHYSKEGIDFVFFSAKHEQERLDEEERMLHGMLGAEAARQLGADGLGHLTALEAFVTLAPYLPAEDDPREDSLLGDQAPVDHPDRLGPEITGMEGQGQGGGERAEEVRPPTLPSGTAVGADAGDAGDAGAGAVAGSSAADASPAGVGAGASAVSDAAAAGDAARPRATDGAGNGGGSGARGAAGTWGAAGVAGTGGNGGGVGDGGGDGVGDGERSEAGASAGGSVANYDDLVPDAGEGGRDGIEFPSAEREEAGIGFGFERKQGEEEEEGDEAGPSSGAGESGADGTKQEGEEEEEEDTTREGLFERWLQGLPEAHRALGERCRLYTRETLMDELERRYGHLVLEFTKGKLSGARRRADEEDRARERARREAVAKASGAGSSDAFRKELAVVDTSRRGRDQDQNQGEGKEQEHAGGEEPAEEEEEDGGEGKEQKQAVAGSAASAGAPGAAAGGRSAVPQPAAAGPDKRRVTFGAGTKEHEGQREPAGEQEQDEEAKARDLAAEARRVTALSDAAAISDSLEMAKQRPLVVGMVGYPNVGKSSVINVLLGASTRNHNAKRVAVGATPGKTKHFQTLPLSDSIQLCDCPGLVFPSFVSTKAEMVVNGILPIDQLREHAQPIMLVCQRVPRVLLERIYGIAIPKPKAGQPQDRPPTVRELLDTFCHARGFMAATHAGCDHPRASRVLLKDMMNGKLLYCHPPPSSMDPDAYKMETVRSRMELVRREGDGDGEPVGQEDEAEAAGEGPDGGGVASAELYQYGPNVLRASEIVRTDPVTGAGGKDHGGQQDGQGGPDGQGTQSKAVQAALRGVPGTGAEGAVDVDGVMEGLGMGAGAGLDIGIDLDDPLLLETLGESGALGGPGAAAADPSSGAGGAEPAALAGQGAGGKTLTKKQMRRQMQAERKRSRAKKGKRDPDPYGTQIADWE